MTKFLRTASLALALVLGVGCAADTDETDESIGEDAAFLSSGEDEAIDPSDPPTDPDPPEERGKCPARGKLLSPKGLTFAIHISKHKDEAERAVDHLIAVKKHLRARDIFLVEHTSPVLDRLEKAFPCNAIHYIAYPEELDTALATGGRIDGIAVDWERNVFNHDQAYTIEKLKGFAAKIRKKGKVPGFVPWMPASFDDGEITRKSGMDYEINQIQNQCKVSPAAFAAATRQSLLDFKAKNNPLRNLGVEISLNAVPAADNEVGPDRAAACTRAGYGKGARTIYLYGNGKDHFVPYFKELHAMGMRHAGRS